MNTSKVYLNAYTTDQEYGGPEEGGWWYDTYEPAAAVPIVLREGELEEVPYDDDDDRSHDPFRDNVSCDIPGDASKELLIELDFYRTLLLDTLEKHGWGIDRIITRWELWPAQVAPTRKPHYE